MANEQPDSEGMVTTEQTRRSIAERVITRARARGMPIDNDPEYMAIVEMWIGGEISIQEMRQRYIALLQERARAFRAQAAGRPSVTAEEQSAMNEISDQE